MNSERRTSRRAAFVNGGAHVKYSKFACFALSLAFYLRSRIPNPVVPAFSCPVLCSSIVVGWNLALILRAWTS